VTMNTSPANSISAAFFSDWSDALDRIYRHHLHHPIILTGQGTIFSAGVDIKYAFDRKHGPEAVSFLQRYFQQMGDFFVRHWTIPVPTIAAINGHAIAGGCIMALVHDFRVAVNATPAPRIGLNEVQVGVPFPPFAIEIPQRVLANNVARMTIMGGNLYEFPKASQMGILDEVVNGDKEALLQTAIAWAKKFPPHSLPAFRVMKEVLLAPSLERLKAQDKNEYKKHAENLIKYYESEAGWDAVQRTLAKLKTKK